MKTLHLSIITVTGIAVIGIIFFVVILPSMQHQTTGNVEIQNIQVQPSTVRIGDTFTVNATLVNNSQNPIDVTYSSFCGSPFYVIFDSHVIVDVKQTICAIGLRMDKVNPGEKIIRVGPDSLFAFRATESGITNATVTFYYEEKNQTGPNLSNIKKTISKSFLFTISDNITGTATDQKSSAKESIRIIPEYPITGGFGNNGTVQVFFTIEILFDNFKRTDSPLIVKIFNPKGELYKEDNIPSSNIQSDGFYKYKIYIVGNEGSDLGKYQVVVTYDNATALTSAYLSNTFP